MNLKYLKYVRIFQCLHPLSVSVGLSFWETWRHVPKVHFLLSSRYYHPTSDLHPFSPRRAIPTSWLVSWQVFSFHPCQDTQYTPSCTEICQTYLLKIPPCWCCSYSNQNVRLVFKSLNQKISLHLSYLNSILFHFRVLQSAKLIPPSCSSPWLHLGITWEG